MNTLRVTDEGRARPSVWPVYVAAAVIGLVSLCHLTRELRMMLIGAPLFDRDSDMFFIMYGLFGAMTAWGLVKLQDWGWFCTAVWTMIFVLTPDMQGILIHGVRGLSVGQSAVWLVLAASQR